MWYSASWWCIVKNAKITLNYPTCMELQSVDWSMQIRFLNHPTIFLDRGNKTKYQLLFLAFTDFYEEKQSLA